MPIYFCVLPIDMRRSFDTLAELVRESLGKSHDQVIFSCSETSQRIA